MSAMLSRMVGSKASKPEGAHAPTASIPTAEEVCGACDEYRVDMTASRFGDCKCGFPKSAHKESAVRTGARPRGTTAIEKTAFFKKKVEDDLGEWAQACDEYRVDMTAARFGDCKCGFPKSAHKATAVCAPAAASSNRNGNAAAARARFAALPTQAPPKPPPEAPPPKPRANTAPSRPGRPDPGSSSAAASSGNGGYRDHMFDRSHLGSRANWFRRQFSSTANLSSRRSSAASVDDSERQENDSDESSEDEGESSSYSRADADAALAQRRRAQTADGRYNAPAPAPNKPRPTFGHRLSITFGLDGMPQRVKRTRL